MGSRTIIINAIGCFIVSLDAIPDFTTAIGYGDDFGALAATVSTVSMYIDGNVKQKNKR